LKKEKDKGKEGMGLVYSESQPRAWVEWCIPNLSARYRRKRKGIQTNHTGSDGPTKPAILSPTFY